MDFALNNEAVFPEGTEVGAYPASNWPTPAAPVGEPTGSSAAEATVEDGVALLGGLDPRTAYWAVAEVGGAWRYVAFQTGSGVEGQVGTRLEFNDLEKGEDYTLQLSDEGKVVRVPDPEEEEGEPASVTITVPADETADFPVGARVWIAQGAGSDGNVFLAPAEGVAVRFIGEDGELKSEGQYRQVCIVKWGANEWQVEIPLPTQWVSV